jgi:hypothetical protein
LISYANLTMYSVWCHRMKGQLSYIIKPLSLVLTIVLLLLLYNSISTFQINEKTAEQDLNLVADSTNILLVLANSPLCLAYKAPATEGLYANIVDAQKLDYFSQQYSSIEPECARSYDYGWRVTVKEFKQSGNSIIFGKAWSFGAANFSRDAAFRNSLNFSMPIAIHYSDMLTRPGLMTLTLVGDELEKIAGAIDWTCQLHRQGRLTKSTVQIYTSYPLIYDQNSKSLCQVSKTNFCRITTCNLDFQGFGAPGNYPLRISFDGDKEVIK